METPNLTEILENEWYKTDEIKKEFHIHLPNKLGASAVASCIYANGLKRSGVPIPIREDISSERGGLYTGTWLHDRVQNTLDDFFIKNIDGRKEQWKREVYVTVELDNGMIVESPIDYASVTAPGFVQVPMKFKNTMEMVWMKHPSAKWNWIIDIKSAGDYGFYKILRDGVPEEYSGQFHIYMKGTQTYENDHLQEITCLLIHKAKGRIEEIPHKWDGEMWKKVNENVQRFMTIAEDPTEFNYRIDDFECLKNPSGIEWYSCPWSKTHEEIKNNGAPALILDLPCDKAIKMIEQEAEKKFKKGQQWKRGSSIVTIGKIVGNLIFATNKGGKIFEDSLWTAMKKYKEIEKK